MSYEAIERAIWTCLRTMQRLKQLNSKALGLWVRQIRQRPDLRISASQWILRDTYCRHRRCRNQKVDGSPRQDNLIGKSHHHNTNRGDCTSLNVPIPHIPTSSPTPYDEHTEYINATMATLSPSNPPKLTSQCKFSNPCSSWHL